MHSVLLALSRVKEAEAKEQAEEHLRFVKDGCRLQPGHTQRGVWWRFKFFSYYYYYCVLVHPCHLKIACAIACHLTLMVSVIAHVSSLLKEQCDEHVKAMRVQSSKIKEARKRGPSGQVDQEQRNMF